MIPIAEPDLRGNELKYVTDCVVTEWVSSLGKYVRAFEERIAEFCGRRYAVSTCNGTAALHLALVTLGIGPGDEVIVPSLTFVATANAVSYTGATPVFIDSERDYWQLDPSLLEGLINERTKAIIPVDLYGHPADMDAIEAIAQRHHLSVIEDAAEAHGALYKGRPCGTFGDISCFSFYGNKVITTGEGGMLLTDDADLCERARFLHDHAMAPEADWARNVYWMYSILIDEDYAISREAFQVALRERGVDTRPFFRAIHTMPCHRRERSLPVAEYLSSHGVNLPSSVKLTPEQIVYICQQIAELAG